jgi:hypothetical protein
VPQPNLESIHSGIERRVPVRSVRSVLVLVLVLVLVEWRVFALKSVLGFLALHE